MDAVRYGSAAFLSLGLLSVVGTYRLDSGDVSQPVCECKHQIQTAMILANKAPV
jgi:hypothetical protein